MEFQEEILAPTGARLAFADHPLRGIFHPLGAAFFSNATYPETVKVINATSVSVAPFALAPRPSPNSGNVSTEPVGVPGNSSLEVDPGQSDRQQFRFNYTTGQIEDIPSLSVQFRGLLAAEIPRYARLWQTAFAPLSVPGFKVRHDSPCIPLCDIMVKFW